MEFAGNLNLVGDLEASSSSKFGIDQQDTHQFTGSVEITGSARIIGRLTATEFYTEYVSSSIIYESGSTKFGDSSDDVHQFTGSIVVSGSISADTITVGGSSPITNFSVFQENFNVSTTTNSFTVSSANLPTNEDSIMIYYNGQFINKTYISSFTTNTINLTFSAESGDKIDIIWFTSN